MFPSPCSWATPVSRTSPGTRGPPWPPASSSMAPLVSSLSPLTGAARRAPSPARRLHCWCPRVSTPMQQITPSVPAKQPVGCNLLASRCSYRSRRRSRLQQRRVPVPACGVAVAAPAWSWSPLGAPAVPHGCSIPRCRRARSRLTMAGCSFH